MTNISPQEFETPSTRASKISNQWQQCGLIWELQPSGTFKACTGIALLFFFLELYTRVIQKLKMQNGWQGKGNDNCEGGNAVVSSILPFPFVFAFKETSGWPEVSRRWRGEIQSHYVVVQAGSGVLWHCNENSYPS